MRLDTFLCLLDSSTKPAGRYDFYSLICTHMHTHQTNSQNKHVKRQTDNTWSQLNQKDVKICSIKTSPQLFLLN